MDTMDSAEELLALKEVAARLHCSARSVRRWIAAGLLPAVTLPSGRIRVRPRAVEAMLSQCGQSTKPRKAQS